MRCRAHPIDRFVRARLRAHGLEPHPEAPKDVLIRRVSLALTGLPPTPDEVDAFVRDTSPDAYERVVDRLLASPAYGERMAADWLDIARFADTHGYQDDVPRDMSPWRDWVIEAFNRNMPVDQFITWQLAGDLLPNATREQRLATAFNRHHMQSQEGGIVPEEYRVEYVADRVQTLGRAFLGVTLECARCHDHKYDPIQQREYFQLYAFFNSINEAGQAPYSGMASPTVILPSAEADARLGRAAHRAHGPRTGHRRGCASLRRRVRRLAARQRTHRVVATLHGRPRRAPAARRHASRQDPGQGQGRQGQAGAEADLCQPRIVTDAGVPRRRRGPCSRDGARSARRRTAAARRQRDQVTRGRGVLRPAISRSRSPRGSASTRLAPRGR